MKRILIILVIIAALLVTAWLAPRILADPGYVMIDVAGWRLESSLLVLAGAVIGIWLALSLTLAILRLPGRTVRKTREVWRERNLEHGLLALSEGDWQRAEKLLQKALKSEGSTVGYLAAARAAQGQAEPGRRDHYLRLADSGYGHRSFVTGLARAGLLTAEGDTRAAVPVLENLHLKKPRHPGVLRMLLQAYQEAGRWQDVRLLAPALRRSGVMDKKRAEELVELAATRELEDALDAQRLEQIWSQLPRRVHQSPRVVNAFATRAAALGRSELAEPEIRRCLDREWSPELLDTYSGSAGEDVPARLAQCLKWKKKHSDDPSLKLAMGRLYLRENRFEEAAACLEDVVKSRPTAEAWESLGRVMDRDGRMDAASQCYRNALRMRHGRPVDPLPPPESETSLPGA